MTGVVAVVDANIIVSGIISPHGLPNRVLRAWQQDLFVLISSDELVAEVSDVLSRPRIRERFRLTEADIRALTSALATSTVAAMPLEQVPIRCRDPKDQPVLACALGGHADFIVSGDDDLLVLDRHEALGGLRIVTARDFLFLIGAEVPQ